MTRYLIITTGLMVFLALLTSPANALTSETLFESDNARESNTTQPRTISAKQALKEQETLFRGILSCWKTLAQSYSDPGFQQQSNQQKASILRQHIDTFYRCLPRGTSSSLLSGSSDASPLKSFSSRADTEFLLRLSTVHIQEKPSSKKSSSEPETQSEESEKQEETPESAETSQEKPSETGVSSPQKNNQGSSSGGEENVESTSSGGEYGESPSGEMPSAN